MAARRAFPLSRLGAELSVVINRVRRAFGPFSMAEAAFRAQIVQAEREVALVAWQVAQGERGPDAWQRALDEYEGVWMELLGELRRAEESRHAA